jgi:hypothetical protein
MIRGFASNKEIIARLRGQTKEFQRVKPTSKWVQRRRLVKPRW